MVGVIMLLVFDSLIVMLMWMGLVVWVGVAVVSRENVIVNMLWGSVKVNLFMMNFLVGVSGWNGF